MTKEQIKQKAEAEADKVVIGSGWDRASVIHLKHLLVTMYMQGATEATKKLEKENAELKEELKAIDKAGEHVRQQINNAFRNKKPYWELEKENAEFKEQLYAFDEEREKLRKENEELRRNEFNARSCLELQQSQDKAIVNYMGEQLTKAKELLAKLLEEEKNNMYWEMNGSDKSSYYEVRKQVEQFLSDSKQGE